jgi:hypothetical protein
LHPLFKVLAGVFYFLQHRQDFCEQHFGLGLAKVLGQGPNNGVLMIANADSQLFQRLQPFSQPQLGSTMNPL